MSDGNTALPVSPVQSEEDTMKLASLFQRAAKAVVDASEMPKQIEALQTELNLLRRDFQRSQDHANMLDQQLLDMRQQRNNAEDKLAEASRKIDGLTTDLAAMTQERDHYKRQAEELTVVVTQVRRDLDDTTLHSMQLEEDLSKARQAIKEVREKVSALFPEAMAQPAPNPEPVAVPTQDASQGTESPGPVEQYHPQPEQAAQSAEANPSPPANDPDRNWWDKDRNQA